MTGGPTDRLTQRESSPTSQENENELAHSQNPPPLSLNGLSFLLPMLARKELLSRVTSPLNGKPQVNTSLAVYLAGLLIGH